MLLNLLNELEKRKNARLGSRFNAFRNEFNRFTNVRK